MSILAPVERYLPQVFTRQAVDYWLQKVSKRASVRATIAEVVAKEERVPGIVTLQLRPNARWRGFRAGQHVELSVEVDGRRLVRRWTISSGETSRTLELNISRIPDGRVTPWVHERVQVGDRVELSEAKGEFTLPENYEDIVFVAGGVGVTPALSMIRTLQTRGFRRGFTLVHYVRNAELALAKKELETLAIREPFFRYLCVETRDSEPGAADRQVSADNLRAMNLLLDRSEVYVCGPGGFMDATQDAVHAIAPNAKVQREHFVIAKRSFEGAGGRVFFSASNASHDADDSTSVLEAAEAAGLQPAFGCRAGICMQCACTKKSGVVVDVRSGVVLSEDNQRIQLCITRPVGPVEIDL